ncbi:MAG: hypothetical protein HDT01_02225 [Bacteroidales bacterium]|nr:hypothetical protein [Bacteroidales bacterium]
MKKLLFFPLAAILGACTGNTGVNEGITVIDPRFEGTHFYGAGERGHALNLRGDTLEMYNRPNYGYGAGDSRINVTGISMPLLLTENGYGILFDDFAAARLVTGDTISYFSESTSPVSYHIIDGGGTLAGAVEAMTAITGRQEMPPLWTLGYITSKYGYKTEAETLGVADTLKRRGYPVDGLVLDLYWYGKEEDMGVLDWESSAWPNPAGMLDSLNKQNINVVAISQPFVLSNGRGKDNFDYLSQNGLLLCDSTGTTQPVEIWVGEGGMFDVSNDSTRAWLADRYDALTQQGIYGWWGDLGEPEKHPETALHANGMGARQYHNRYGNDWASIIYDMNTERYPERRPMILMRGGTTGLQKYSVFPWTGDVSRSWEGMQAQPTLMIQSGLSGLGYMSHDVGGFAVDSLNPRDPEMYTRWMQMGLFSPMLRTHSQIAAEPYHYPEVESILLDLVKERYAWLPYNYTLAWENSSRGLPLVRPMNFYSGSKLHDDITDQYLWGRDILVAPVMERGARERNVVVPDGKWLDIENPENVFSSGDTVLMTAPLSRIPLMVRAGAFIPRADYAMSSTADYDPTRLTVDYYPVEGVTSDYTLYDDDLTTPSRGNYSYRTVTFDGTATGSEIVISSKLSGDYPGARPLDAVTLRIHRVYKRPVSVTAGGKDVPFSYDAGSAIITLEYKLNNKLIIKQW